MTTMDTAAMAMLERAQGCLLGQCAGDALGSLVEFQSSEQIRRAYPDGVREMADGGAWNTIAGQPTDDSEMALMLARMLVRTGTYDREDAKAAYLFWLDSDPFDVGYTVRSGLRGQHNPDSQANGAMMRISPLGIFGARHELSQVAQWAREDAAITHINPICQQANALYAMAMAYAVRKGCDSQELYALVDAWARDMPADGELLATIEAAADAPPDDMGELQGWVLKAFQNALWQLRHAESLEQGVIDTVMRGGDTDTTAAIAGALMGAVYGRRAIPAQWEASLLNCRPQAGKPGVYQPRPECFWPVDALELAAQLIGESGDLA